MGPVEPWSGTGRYRGAWLKLAVHVARWSVGGLGEPGWKSMAAKGPLGPRLPCSMWAVGLRAA